MWVNLRAASVNSHRGAKPTCVFVPTTQGALRQGLRSYPSHPQLRTWRIREGMPWSLVTQQREAEPGLVQPLDTSYPIKLTSPLSFPHRSVLHSHRTGQGSVARAGGVSMRVTSVATIASASSAPSMALVLLYQD